jgi:hypothetical protein
MTPLAYTCHAGDSHMVRILLRNLGSASVTTYEIHPKALREMADALYDAVTNLCVAI